MTILTREQSPRHSFCVPAALAIATGADLHTVESHLRDFLGDNAQKGIFYPVALATLAFLGFNYNEVGKNYMYRNPGIYLIFYRTHAVVHRNGFWFDNSCPQGQMTALKSGKIEKIFRVVAS